MTAEGVGAHAIKTNDPPPQGGELGRRGRRVADAGGLEPAVCLRDRVGEPEPQVGHVGFVGRRAQGAHRRRRRMRVGGRDRHVVGRNARALGRERLGVVDEVLRQHAAVGDHDGDRRVAVRQHERTGLDVARLTPTGRHAPIDEDGELLRRHIHHARAGVQFGHGRRGADPRCREE